MALTTRITLTSLTLAILTACGGAPQSRSSRTQANAGDRNRTQSQSTRLEPFSYSLLAVEAPASPQLSLPQSEIPGVEVTEQGLANEMNQRFFAVARRQREPRRVTVERVSVDAKILREGGDSAQDIRDISVEVERWQSESLFERPEGHGSTHWFADFFAIDAEAPTLILVHHLDSDSEAMQGSRGICHMLQQSGVQCLLMYLPLYGPREQRGETFLDFEVSRTADSIQQGLLDLLAVRSAAEAHPRINAENLGVFGLSLGAMFASVSAAVFPAWSGGVVLGAAGGDLASILVNFLHFQEALCGAEEALEAARAAREELTWADPLLWSEVGPRQRLLSLTMSNDALMTREATQVHGLDIPATYAPFREQLAGVHDLEEVQYEGSHRDLRYRMHDVIRRIHARMTN
jgi:pimeloyl-ACP methyl ester carboxylesterase